MWFEVVDRWRSCSVPHDFDNAALAAFATNLPVFYHSLFPTDRPGATCPENASSKVSLRFHVLEYQRRLALNR